MLDLETAKVIVGTASTAIIGVQGILKIYHRIKWLMRPQVTQGVTIFNGEAKQLFAAIGRIEKRQDSLVEVVAKSTQTANRAIGILEQRVLSIEDRLASGAEAQG